MKPPALNNTKTRPNVRHKYTINETPNMHSEELREDQAGNARMKAYGEACGWPAGQGEGLGSAGQGVWAGVNRARSQDEASRARSRAGAGRARSRTRVGRAGSLGGIPQGKVLQTEG